MNQERTIFTVGPLLESKQRALCSMVSYGRGCLCAVIINDVVAGTLCMCRDEDDDIFFDGSIFSYICNPKICSTSEGLSKT